MKKPLLIIFGVILILALVGVWLFLMVFNTSESREEVFTSFGFQASDRSAPAVTPEEDTLDENSTQQVDTAGEALRQLTTRPVAGYTIITASSGSAVRYAEVGTGHIYEIDIPTGNEVRLSGTTIPRVSEAVFSADGNSVALTSINGYLSDIFVAKIITGVDTTGSLKGINLPPNASEPRFFKQDINYTLSSKQGTVGYRFNIDTLFQQEIFSVPFTSIKTIWEQDGAYIYNRPSAQLEGSLFYTKDTSYKAIAPTTYGFSALINENHIVYTESLKNRLDSTIIDRTNGTTRLASLVAIAEKCVFDNDILWCAHNTKRLGDFLEKWYQGSVTSEDSLWGVDLLTGDGTIIANLSNLSGRIIDVTNLQKASDSLYFINKIDNTLWLYDLSV